MEAKPTHVALLSEAAGPPRASPAGLATTSREGFPYREGAWRLCCGCRALGLSSWAAEEEPPDLVFCLRAKAQSKVPGTRRCDAGLAASPLNPAKTRMTGGSLEGQHAKDLPSA